MAKHLVTGSFSVEIDIGEENIGALDPSSPPQLWRLKKLVTNMVEQEIARKHSGLATVGNVELDVHFIEPVVEAIDFTELSIDLAREDKSDG